MIAFDESRFWERIKSEMRSGELPAGPSGAALCRFAGEVARWSGRVHLVGRKHMEENITVLALDSLHLLRFAERARALQPGGDGSAAAVADIGSGAGFPGMVWKIVRPDVEMTLFERREKPALFIERVIAGLRLKGVRVVAADAEAFEAERPFDLVVSKASGRLGAIAPIAERILRVEGAYLTIKGKHWQREIAEPGGGVLAFESDAPLPHNRGSMLQFRKRP